MAAIIKPLGNVLLTSDSTDANEPEELYDVDGANPLVSVIVTNTVSTNGEFYIYVTTSSFPTGVIIAYRQPISGYNTYETFRFALDGDDTLYVAGSAGLSFYAQGIEQEVLP
jgi:hypothetical protein